MEMLLFNSPDNSEIYSIAKFLNMKIYPYNQKKGNINEYYKATSRNVDKDAYLCLEDWGDEIDLITIHDQISFDFDKIKNSIRFNKGLIQYIKDNQELFPNISFRPAPQDIGFKVLTNEEGFEFIESLYPGDCLVVKNG